MAVFLALAAALLSGTADFTGGRAARHHSAFIVNLFAHGVSAVLLPICAVLIGWERLRSGDIVLGLVGGVAAGSAYLVFFRALAAGRMSVIAPLAALTTALVPVVVDLVEGVSLTTGRWMGVGLALMAIPALAFRRDEQRGTISLNHEILLAILAGLGFAGFFVCLGHTSTTSGQWPVAFSALGATTATAVMCLARRVPIARPPRAALLTGLLLVTSGLAINHALQLGPLAVVTVLGSLYPLATTSLAHHFDHEPVGRVNVVGIAAALAGAALIAIYQ